MSNKKIKTAQKPNKDVLTEPVRIIRTGFDRKRVQFICTGESMTKQSLAPECHTPNIMARFIKTGELPGDPTSLKYGDQPDGDFQEAQFALARLSTLYEESDTEKPFEGFISEIMDSLTPESEQGDLAQDAGPVSTPEYTEAQSADGGEAPSEASQSS